MRVWRSPFRHPHAEPRRRRIRHHARFHAFAHRQGKRLACARLELQGREIARERGIRARDFDGAFAFARRSLWRELSGHTHHASSRGFGLNDQTAERTHLQTRRPLPIPYLWNCFFLSNVS